ncbi:3-dehydroquinate synthase [Cohnella sp. CIP 111063]|uniref:3-dehydroquinate synthase n=1 Tax=unclassified Cohnella TaxID=2636738 RepID=UPI000B8C43E7|nr:MULTISPECIES: 3-dehydroquinate synthase [unclassified Cohnella]OXS61189.1 3-dehydroquinate synthase [Cohnella sp. CIP 111063]PRX73751.1 3-dehydroquinate synthase [Cohnella sp. SGD-V74]
MAGGTRELTVDLGERSYPIYIGTGLIAELGRKFAERGFPVKSPILLVTDSAVEGLYAAAVEESLRASGYTVVRAVVPSGESSKSLEMLDLLVEKALQAGLDRKSTVIALGGGVVGDLAGFVAASYMRGVKFVQIPTTILAHDSSVGGKVAVNHRLAKNIIGAFHQPEFVLYDLDTLASLPIREVRAGLSEVIKHGLIWNADFVAWCDDNADRLLALEPDALGYALYEGCKVKSIVVSRDERENDLRAILNLGHTIGHALEAVAGYGELLHGEAIAIGMVGSARLAGRFGYSADIEETTERIFRKFGLPVRIPDSCPTDAIMGAMLHDKKFSEGNMVFVVPTAIGSVEIRRDVPSAWVTDIVNGLREGK